MANTLALTDTWNDGKRLFVLGTVLFSGNYTTGGESLDFTTIGVESQQAPEWFDAPQCAGYDSQFFQGTLPNAGNLLKLYSSAGTELASGAYAAALTANAFPFLAIFQMI